MLVILGKKNASFWVWMCEHKLWHEPMSWVFSRYLILAQFQCQFVKMSRNMGTLMTLVSTGANKAFHLRWRVGNCHIQQNTQSRIEKKQQTLWRDLNPQPLNSSNVEHRSPMRYPLHHRAQLTGRKGVKKQRCFISDSSKLSDGIAVNILRLTNTSLPLKTYNY